MEYPDLATKIRSILYYTGLPLDAQTVVEGVKQQEREEVATR